MVGVRPPVRLAAVLGACGSFLAVGTVVRCAPGDQATGLAALRNAGFTIAGTQRWGEAFVCRIEGKPTAATEACVNTPPASAHWSY
ncbi:hypothetical protein [Streptomyces sp. NPDC055632]